MAAAEIQPDNTPDADYSFGHAKRLHGNKAFAAVYDAKCRKNAGPIGVAVRPNDLPHGRLGLSVGKRCGNAVKRHHLKRMLREAWRLTQHNHPTVHGQHIDTVLVVYPHDDLTLEEYKRLLLSGLEQAASVAKKRFK